METIKLSTENRMKTQEDVVHEIQQTIWWLNKVASLEDAQVRTGWPAAFLSIFASLLHKLQLSLRDLPSLVDVESEQHKEGLNIKGSMWCYEIRINAYGVSLQMVKLCVMHDDEPYLYISEDYSYKVAEVKSRRLTLEEFGGRYGVEANTVRQWIRRGKLPMAIKSGTDWRIPELAASFATDDFHLYYIEGDLVDPPEELAHSEEYNMITISRDSSDRKKPWRITFDMDGNQVKEMRMLTREKERLELYLVSQPAAISSHGNIAWITNKNWFPNHVWGMEWMSQEEYKTWEKELQRSI